MLVIVGVIALGAAADPATGRAGTASWTNYHLLGALGGMMFVAWTYFVAWQAIWLNHAVIEGILADVAQLRIERGLELAPTGRTPEAGIIDQREPNRL
jgi:hypothetical protein